MSRLRSLLQASLTATKRALEWNIESLMPPSEKYIFRFNLQGELQKWHLYSDSEYGGLSSASLEITDKDAALHGFSSDSLEITDKEAALHGLPPASLEITGKDAALRGIFSGKLSMDVGQGSKWRMNRSGFCGMRSKKFNGFIDLDAYDTIAMKLRGDGRCYISTIYTENWVNSPGQAEDNSWQAFIHVPSGEWHISQIPLSKYMPTWRGNVIDANLEMNPARIVGMSLSVNAEGGVPGAKTGPGVFQLEIDWIKALRT